MTDEWKRWKWECGCGHFNRPDVNMDPGTLPFCVMCMLALRPLVSDAHVASLEETNKILTARITELQLSSNVNLFARRVADIALRYVQDAASEYCCFVCKPVNGWGHTEDCALMAYKKAKAEEAGQR